MGDQQTWYSPNSTRGTVPTATLTPAADAQKRSVPAATCRMLYGTEPKVCSFPWTTSTRTLGKDQRHVPALVQVKGTCRLEMRRDHPRLVQGLQLLLLGQRNNCDFQLFLGADIVPDIAQLVQNKLGECSADDVVEARAVVATLRKNNPWMDEDCMVQKVIDYVVAYACKGSATSGEMQGIYKSLVHTAKGTTAMTSFAAKFACKVLRDKDIVGQEADSLLLGNPQFFSSRRRKLVSLDGTRRVVNAEAQTGDDAETAGITRDNDWDMFCKRPAAEAAVCFDAYLRAPGRLKSKEVLSRYAPDGVTKSSYTCAWYIRYTGASLHCSVPLSDSYCCGVLMRYKPGARSLGDLLKDPPRYCGWCVMQ